MEKKIDFQYLRDNELLLYEYVRGSQLYGLARPESDEDHGGVYIEPLDALLGTGIGFPEDVHDETNDESWFSLRKYMSLLLNSNPNVLESLYVPEDKIIYKHPVFDIILKERDKFVTKKCFGSFMGYAKTQIEKARNLKKKIVHPIEGPMQSCLEFIMYVYDGGSRPVVKWLEEKGLLQRYCGLVNVDKMPTIYCMYYDWGEHLYNELHISTWEEFRKYVDQETDMDGTKPGTFLDSFFHYGMTQGYHPFYYVSKGDLSMTEVSEKELKRLWEAYHKPFGFRGLVNLDNTSNEVRFSSSSSVPKGEIPLLNVSYNGDGYSTYCRQWKEYNDFKIHHNPERFNLAKQKQFDRKNMCHAARLLTMGIEIARGEGVKIDRTNIDRDFLMNIRLGNTEYDTIMSWLQGQDSKMKESMENSTIPDQIDLDFVDELMIRIRREFYGLSNIK